MNTIFLSTSSGTLPTRAARRIAVVVMWLALIGYTSIVASTPSEGLYGALGGLCIIVCSVTVVMLSRSLGLSAPEMELDERQRLERDRMHGRAYKIIAWAMMIPMLYGFIALRKGLWLPSTPREVVGSFAAAIAAVGLAPVSLLAWQRDDAVFEDEEPHDATEKRWTRYPMRSPGREILFGLFVMSLALLIVRLLGGSIFPVLSASEIAGFATALGLSMLVTRSVK